MRFSIETGSTFVSLVQHGEVAKCIPIARVASDKSEQIRSIEAAIATLQDAAQEIRYTNLSSDANPDFSSVNWITPTIDSRMQINKVVLIRILRDTIRRDGKALLTVKQGATIISNSVWDITNGRPFERGTFEFWCAVMSDAIHTCNRSSHNIIVTAQERN